METPLSEARGARNRGERRDGMASDRSIWDRAMARGRLQSEHSRGGDGRRRQVHSPQASAAADDHGGAKYHAKDHHANNHHAKDHHGKDHAQSQSVRRPGQTIGRADERDLKIQTRKAESRTVRTHSAQLPSPTRVDNDASPARQADVRKAQAALNQQGFNVGDPDGKLGRQTKKALIAFQKQHGFQATGKVDRATLQALDAGGAAQDTHKESRKRNPSKDNSPAEDSANKDSAHRNDGRGRGQAPAANEPATPSTTSAAPVSPQPADAETPATLDGQQMPDASSRVPAGAPQEDYKDDSPGEEQR